MRRRLLDLAVIGCGLAMYGALRNGEVAAIVFFGAFALLVAAVVANHVSRGRSRGPRQPTENHTHS